jgi:hypothetical protein
MDQLFAERGYDRRRRLEALFDEWERVVGDNDARIARPLSVEEGVLTVVVPNSTVASEVSFSRERYLTRVNAYYGFAAVQELRVRVDQRGALDAGRGTRERSQREEGRFQPELVALTREELAWVEENAAHVEGIAARTGLRRALMVFVKRRKWESERRRIQDHT